MRRPVFQNDDGVLTPASNAQRRKAAEYHDAADQRNGHPGCKQQQGLRTGQSGKKRIQERTSFRFMNIIAGFRRKVNGDIKNRMGTASDPHEFTPVCRKNAIGAGSV